MTVPLNQKFVADVKEDTHVVSFLLLQFLSTRKVLVGIKLVENWSTWEDLKRREDFFPGGSPVVHRMRNFIKN